LNAIRKRTAELLEARRPDDPWGRIVDYFLVFLIFTNVLLIILETEPSLKTSGNIFYWRFEIFSVAVFTLEYLLRLWSCVDRERQPAMSPARARLRWVFSPLGLIDLLAILSFYIFMFWPGAIESLLMLRIFRGLRLLRVLKLTRYSPAWRILRTVLVREANTLVVVAFIMMVTLIMASWGIYIFERIAQPEHFGSLPRSFWWAVVTITTVGYGDVVPLTPPGKFFGGIVALVGIGMAALPAGIMASGFTTEMRRREAVFYREVRRTTADGELTEEEDQQIKLLAKNLGLNHGDVFAVMRDAVRDMHSQTSRCPHCGKSLGPDDP
jgi:voltage-gated potassium channel